MSQGKGIYQLEYLTIILAYVCVKGVLSDITSVPFRSSLGLTRALQVSLVGHIIGASLSEPHTNGTSAARVCYIYRTYVVP